MTNDREFLAALDLLPACSPFCAKKDTPKHHRNCRRGLALGKAMGLYESPRKSKVKP